MSRGRMNSTGNGASTTADVGDGTNNATMPEEEDGLDEVNSTEAMLYGDSESGR